MINKTIITSRDIPDAWFQVCESCWNYGREYIIEEGSYVGQKRKELDFLCLHILYPYSRPLLPETPDGLPDPVDGGIEFIENEYIRTILTDEIRNNETYTYGKRLFSKICDFEKRNLYLDIRWTNPVEEVINKFRRGFANNQCCLSISEPYDILLSDPPCLRSIDLRIFEDEKKLHMYTYWRSWDAFNGLPANLAALVYLQEYICHEIKKDIIPGEFICMSKGVHIYDHAWSSVRDYIG